MYPKQPKSKFLSSVVTAVLQIIGSMFVAAIFFAASIYRLVTVFTSQGSLAAAFACLLAGAGVSGVLLYCAVRNLTYLSRSRAVMSALERRLGRWTMQDMADELRRPADKLSDELQIMINRGYFSIPIQLDLYRGLIIPGSSGPVLPPEPGPGDETMSKLVTRRSPAPFGLAGVSLLLCFYLFPMTGPRQYAGAGLLCLAVLAASWRMYPPLQRVVQVKRPAPPKVKEPVKKTGNKDVDDALKAARAHLEELQRLDRAITNPQIDATVQRMVGTAREILSYVGEHPEKLRQIRQFLGYYLPTTVKLLDTYDDFSRQEVKGDNIRQSMVKIEGMMTDIDMAFQKELDNLYLDKAIDISTDIDVMQAMLHREGIGGADSPR